MKLIIAEKPNVMKELKVALEPTAQYVKAPGAGYYKGKQFIFVCSLGHIIVQKQPKEIDEEYGDLHTFEHLPFPIRPVPLAIGRAPARDYYNTLRKALLEEHYDEIIVAPDPDREGQGIYERIKAYMKGFPKNVSESRMWIKEWTKEGLRDAFYNRTPNAKYKGLGDAEECRAYDDYTVGMNGTTACTAQFDTFLSVGRVQTAVNKIIVAREEEIAAFVPQKYQALSLVVGSDVPGQTIELKHKTDKHLSKQEADAFHSQLQRTRSVKVAVTEKKTSKKPMKLGGQTDFLQVMNKKYGYDAKKTSNLLQALYQDKKLTTYPGTEAHEISVSAAKEALKPLKNLVGKLGQDIDRLITQVLDNGWQIARHCVTDKELAHEAITPVFGSVSSETINGLNQAEMNCYLEVVKRYLQAFYPNAVFNETVVNTVVENEEFEAKGKVLIEKGFFAVIGTGKDAILPHMTNGRVYPVVQVNNEEKETKPPARYTEATLLEAMKNAGRFVDDKHYADILKSEEVEGLGTGRTRSVILDVLKTRGYYVVKNKSIYATQTALDLIRLLPDNIMITSPVMTAQLEEQLKLVETGQVSKEAHMDATDAMVAEMIRSIRAVNGRVTSKQESLALCSCPRCGGDIIENSKAYTCSKKCGIVLLKEDKFFGALGKKITASRAKALFTKRQVIVKNIVSKKTNKQYDLLVKVDFSGQWPKYTTEFPEKRRR